MRKNIFYKIQIPDNARSPANARWQIGEYVLCEQSDDNAHTYGFCSTLISDLEVYLADDEVTPVPAVEQDSVRVMWELRREAKI